MMTASQRLENYNYWNDNRTISAMITKCYKIQSSGTGSGLVLIVPERYWEYLGDFDGEGLGLTTSELKQVQQGLTVPGRFCICDMCQGHGKVVNPSIDCGGISDDDFRSDPDFEEAYFSGMYDISCPECNGERVVARANFDQLSPLAKKIVQWGDEWMKEAGRSAMENVRELALGA